MFTASILQTCTYLFGVCLFSIALLVFLNSSISFVVTDLLGLRHGVGDAIGTLGFADELLALVCCPIWGMLSDRVGVRLICTVGYAIIACSLAVLVQAANVYPQLLLGRLLFSLGGSAVTTMVTAVLPCVATTEPSGREGCSVGARREGQSERRGTYGTGVDVSSQATPSGATTVSEPQAQPHDNVVESVVASGLVPNAAAPMRRSSSKLAGCVGTVTGCGAVFALLFLLPLPAYFEKHRLSAPESVKRSFYVAAGMALCVSLFCFIGLRHLEGDKPGNWKAAFRYFGSSRTGPAESFGGEDMSYCPASYFSQFRTSVVLGVTRAGIGLAYIGGFVARASSVGISLFIPAYINQYYRHAGLCNNDSHAFGTGGIKQSCPRAYIAASILTGVSQLIALCCAPLFGILSAKSYRHHIPLWFGSLSGVIGYLLLALLCSPQIEGNVPVFISMALIGISQIGAIVCSLGLLGDEVMGITQCAVASAPADTDERSALLPVSDGQATKPQDRSLIHLKGSIAGMYSLAGGAGILILTKVGGVLSDKLHPASPFYVLAGFNGILLVASIAASFSRKAR